VTLIEYLLGDAHRILLTDCQQARYDVAPFLDALRRNGNKDFHQLLALLDKTARHGVVWNDFKTKRLKGDAAKQICEFKARGGTRILWFFDEDENALIICTHAFTKKKETTPTNEIERAQERRRLYYEQKKSQP
jgi:phage-related protein